MALLLTLSGITGSLLRPICFGWSFILQHMLPPLVFDFESQALFLLEGFMGFAVAVQGGQHDPELVELALQVELE